MTLPPDGGPMAEPVPETGPAEPVGGIFFPSPDGKWIAAITPVPTDVAGLGLADRTITVAPAAGGPGVVLTQIIGGPGVMSTQPWSPDSKRLTFVSYRPVS